MATASDELTQALQDVASGKAADSQAAESDDSEITQAAKAAVAAGKPADAEGKAQSTEGDKSKTVPYERFSEVVSQKNEASERLKALESQFKSVSDERTSLNERVKQLETDHQILEAIKGLAKDPRYSKDIVRLDKALQGIHEEQEEAKEKGDDKTLSKLEEQWKEKVAEIEDMQAEQRAQALWNDSSTYARQLLASLPDEYSDEDKAIISKLWTPEVNWDTIEEQGREVIPAELKKSLAAVIKTYGTPRGAVVEKTKQEVMKNVPKSIVQSNDEFRKEVESKDWASMKDGQFEQSDADFSAAVGELLRRGRAS